MDRRPRDVLLVDDHPVVRQGLRALLVDLDWVAAVHEAADGATAVRVATRTPVDLVVLDMALPDISGAETCRRILAVRPAARVLVLSLHDDPDSVEAALRAGARGYLLKDQEPDDLVSSLHAVADGGVVLGPRAGDVLAGRPARETGPPAFATLTERERQLLTALAAARSNRQIAHRLGLSEKTVRNQMTALFEKIGVRDRVGAALLAQRNGLVGTEDGWRV